MITNEEYLKKVKDYLVSRKIAGMSQIDEFLKEADENNSDIFDVLIKEKILDGEDAARVKGHLLNIPYVDLRKEVIKAEALKEVPERAALFYKFMPFEINNDVIKIAMVDPSNIDALDALKFISLKRNLNADIYITSKSSFDTAVRQFRKFGEELKNMLENADQQIIKKEDSKKKKTEIQSISDEAPVAKIVNTIIIHAVEGRASDIHVEPNENELKVRYRLDGILYDSLILPKRISSAVVSRIKILSNLKIDETRKPQDGRFRFNHSSDSNVEKNIDLRVSTFPTVNGEKVAIRILDTSADIGNLESLGIWKKNLDIVNENISKPFGIILVTGPTGSGKSTTLYAMLKILNKEGVNIVTLEDPVEYFMVGVNQSQVQSEIGYTFSSGLRSILRQDPDIIMVGEIRDKETAELATHAALTGHLVLSTLHTNNAIGVIPRLIDIGIEPFLISSSLNIAIGQRLVRRICKYCKEEFRPSLKMEELIRKELEDIPDDQKKDLNLGGKIKLFRGKGCGECKQSGVSGRVGIYEILSITQEMKEIMFSKNTENDISNQAKKQGMITMKQDGIIKALAGLTTIEEVLRTMET